MVGVGSGKIWVLIYWIVYLVRECGVNFYNILVIMFMNKVVCEMKLWIGNLMGGEVEFIWIFIFYLMCVWILCCDIDWIGYECNFIILDGSD